MTFAHYADPARAIVDAIELGQPTRRLTVVPDDNAVEHIASLLRTGITHGVGRVRWSLRLPLGATARQALLDVIADEIVEGFAPLSPETMTPADHHAYGDPPYWIEIRK